MSIGIDQRSNSLVVRAPDDLFEEVQSLVRQLDDAEVSSPQATEVISLKSSNSSAVQQALAALYGDSVSTQGATPSSETSSPSEPRQGTRGRAQRDGNGASTREAETMRRREQFFEGIRRFQEFQQRQQVQRRAGRE